MTCPIEASLNEERGPCSAKLLKEEAKRLDIGRTGGNAVILRSLKVRQM